MAKNRPNTKKETKISLTPYIIRFTLIYCANIVILLSLKYQVGLKDTLIFTLLIIILSSRFTSTKFILDHKRLFTPTEKMKLIWASWGLVWFISVMATVLLTYAFAGKEVLSTLVVSFSSMPTAEFIFTISIASAVVFGLLYITYGFNTKREFEIFKKQGKI